MATHYLGTASNGRIVSRKSNRSDFTHAAIGPGNNNGRLPSFSTSPAGALKNADSNYLPTPHEVVELRIVTPAEYREATKGKPART